MGGLKVVNTICQINRGGFGIIDKVLLSDGREVARKTFKPQRIDEANDAAVGKMRTRFIREVKTMERLPPDLFMPIIGHHLSGDNPWFLMPIADEVYFNEIVDAKNSKRVPNGLSDILNSLEALHDLGYVHRDVKPQNILLHEGSWKLSDFGLISYDESVLSDTITSTDAYAGTQMYMAPEQLHDFKKADERADIYSFGAILHDIFGNSARTPYSKLSASGSIGFIIEKCTEENYKRRFKNVKSLRSALLTTLAKDEVENLSEDGQEWLEELDNCEKWNEEKFEKFLFAIRSFEQPSAIWYDLKESHFTALHEIDIDLWETLSTMFLSWVEARGFPFNYCDVLIGRIKAIYTITKSIDIQCKCILSAVELGSSHNRFYVMRRLIPMASESINENLANRVAIEIHVDGNGYRSKFIACVHQIGFEKRSYHPIIAAALD